MYKSIKITLLSILGVGFIVAQELEDLSDDLMISWDQLHYKSDLNKVELEELIHICGGDSLAHQIIQERNRSNGFSDIKELWGVKGMTEKVYLNLSDKFTVVHQPWKHFKHQVFKIDAYSALLWSNRNLKNKNSLHIKNRISVVKGPISIAMHYEKDPTELWSPKFNHWGGYLSVITSKRNKSQIILGDYRVQFGFGLAWMMQSDFNSSVFAPNAFNLFKKDKGFNSFDENNFLRGVLYQIQIKNKLRLKCFLSSKNTDYSKTDESYNKVVNNVKDSAYRAKDYSKFMDFKGGTALSYQLRNFELAAFSLFQRDIFFSDSLKRKEPIQQWGFFIKKYWGNCLTYLEWTNFNGAHAFKSGLEYKWGKRSAFYADMVYKNQNVNSWNDFSLFSFPNSSELSLYAALQINITKSLQLVFNWSEKKELESFYPRNKMRWSLLIRNKLSRSWQFYVKIQWDDITDYKTDDLVYKVLHKDLKWSIRWHHHIEINEHNIIKMRWEWNTSQRNNVKEKGYLFFIDYIHIFPKIFKLKTRFQYFNIPSYQSRIYVFQQNIRYLYAMKAFYFKGWQCLVNLESKWNKKWHSGIHLGWIHYENHEQIKQISQSIPYPLMLNLNATLHYRF